MELLRQDETIIENTTRGILKIESLPPEIEER